MNKSIQHLVVCGALIATPYAWAHEGGIEAPDQIVRDSQGHCVQDSQADDVRTGYASPDTPTSGNCVPKVAEAPPAPAPAPEAVKEKITLGAHTLFDFDKSTLRPEGKAELDELVTKMKAVNVTTATLTGHTDSVGSDAYNQGLSERRVNAVMDYLVGAGIDSSIMSASGMGESQPVADNSTRDGRQQNRRVEIEINYTQ